MIRKTFPPNLCRLCGLDKSQGVDVCSPSAKRTGLLLKINKRLSKESVHIAAGDGLPKFVCTDCEVIINEFGEFCKMVHEVQKRLEDEKLSFEEISRKSTTSEIHQRTYKTQPKLQEIGCSVSENTATVSIGPDGKVECKLCQNYLEAEHTTLHMVTHGIGTIISSCRICGHQAELAQFLKSCGRDDKNSVWCENCRFQSNKKVKGNNNVKSKRRTNQNSHTCDVCSKTFRSQAHLSRHKIVHSGAKPFLCEVCGTGFSQKSSLKLHVLSHAGLNPHKCDQCGQSFRFKVSLSSHIMSLHWPNSGSNVLNNDNAYRCDRCGKQFVTAYKLSRHYRCHTGERPYECEQCGRLFSQTCNLNLHRKKHEENGCMPGVKQVAPNYNSVSSKNHIPDTLMSKQTTEQYGNTLLAQPQNGLPSSDAPYVPEPSGVLESSHDPKFLETILQHPVVPCSSLDVTDTPLSTIDSVLLHSAEKNSEHSSQFVSLTSEFGTDSSPLTPEYLTIGESTDKDMQEKNAEGLFTHFDHDSLLYMEPDPSLQEPATSGTVALPTFSSLQTGSSVQMSSLSR